MKKKKLGIALVGCGGMGSAHIEALLRFTHIELVSVIDIDKNRALDYKEQYNAKRCGTDYNEEVGQDDIDIVVVATIPSAHADVAIKALENNKHVLCEKPIAHCVEDAEKIVKAAARSKGKILIGHQLRYKKPWPKIISDIRGGIIGYPLVMRMAGNQMTFGNIWKTQQGLIKDTSPLVDCGVHYVDIMRQIVNCRPVEVYAQGINLVKDILPPEKYNYGLLQVKFEDGSLGHYEAGWGPMMTQNSWYIKDFSGPKGSYSIFIDLDTNTPDAPPTETRFRIQHREIPSSDCEWKDTVLHDKVYDPEPATKGSSLRDMHKYFLEAIENDRDLSGELEAACSALQIVMAADKSIKTGQLIKL